MTKDKSSQATISGFLTLLLFLTVVYIAYACIAALVVKYIFLDYFSRVGFDTDFSYLTVVMMLLFVKLIVSFSASSVTRTLQRSKE